MLAWRNAYGGSSVGVQCSIIWHRSWYHVRGWIGGRKGRGDLRGLVTDVLNLMVVGLRFGRRYIG